MIFSTPERRFDLSNRGLIMGILNVTPDSFSDGGEYLDPAVAARRGLEMLGQGAAILDIGGESSRPGAAEVAAEEEITRILGPIRALRQAGPAAACISVDTWKAPVARAALEAGAEIINDITGLRGDPAMLPLVAERGAAVVIMHMQGSPRTMQQNPQYADVVAEVGAFFQERLAACRAAGLAEERVCFDPGIGFGKTVEHNLQLLRGLPQLVAAAGGRPLLLGVSRKSFIGKLLDTADMARRDLGTAALTAYGRTQGASIFRVHEIQANLDALRLTEAILGS